MSQLSPFVLLQDPSGYVACDWDLVEDAGGRDYWVSFFGRYIETIAKLATEVEVSHGGVEADIAPRAAAVVRDLRVRLDDFAQNPTAHHGLSGGQRSPVTILTLDQWRDEVLRKHGFVDAFALVKDRENEKMVPLLSKVCAQLDALPVPERVRAVVEGVFAGNIFDLGVEATIKMFLGKSPDFFAVREKLQPRPWLVDDFAALSADLEAHAHGAPGGRGAGRFKKAVFFVDNAGSDFVLGAIPMMRFLALGGAEVVLAANERPTLNDMTVAEVKRWWPRLLEQEPSLASLPIRAVSTGTGEPLIDLSVVGDELNQAAEGADLVILEGMGRGVESNFDAKFRCKALNIAMIKDEVIAKRKGGKVFDCVCRYR